MIKTVLALGAVTASLAVGGLIPSSPDAPPATDSLTLLRDVDQTPSSPWSNDDSTGSTPSTDDSDSIWSRLQGAWEFLFGDSTEPTDCGQTDSCGISSDNNFDSPWNSDFPYFDLPNNGSNGNFPGQGGNSGISGGLDESTSAVATTAQSTGVVLINTEVGYDSGEAAGSGLVVSADGLVVTNHHVVADSTAVTVTEPTTGATWDADVLGYDATVDVAVLQLDNASGLTTVTWDDDSVAVGDTVTAVGNAEGGGQLIASPGQVTALNADIEVSSENGSGSSPLNDLIETNAELVAGDSGGALIDSEGEVVGMNVAGSSDPRISIGYAIPIATVQQVTDQVLAGDDSGAVELGRQAALGVTVTDGSSRYHNWPGSVNSWTSSQGVWVVSVADGGAAETAGVTAGSQLTGLDGISLTSLDDLTAALANHQPGDQARLTWTDRSGAEHTTLVTLGEAPLA
jgi:S1-C subfamily serine protease